MNRTVMLVGPFTDEDLRKIIVAVQSIEGQHPEKVFHVLVDDPQGKQAVDAFMEEINPLRKGYERQIKFRRR